MATYLILTKKFSSFSQFIRVAQRITRSATNREIAGSNPVTDNDFFHINMNSRALLKVKGGERQVSIVFIEIFQQEKVLKKPRNKKDFAKVEKNSLFKTNEKGRMLAVS